MAGREHPTGTLTFVRTDVSGAVDRLETTSGTGLNVANPQAFDLAGPMATILAFVRTGHAATAARA